MVLIMIAQSHLDKFTEIPSLLTFSCFIDLCTSHDSISRILLK